MHEALKLWENVMGDVEREVHQSLYITWFKDIALQKINEGTVFVAVPSIFVQEWFAKRYHNNLLKFFRKYDASVRALEYVVCENPDKRKFEMKVRPQKTQENSSIPLGELYVDKIDNLNPKFTFDIFVVGPFNELAHAASQAVIKNPGGAYNPLFIYGNTGLGKTHLIQAVGNQIKKLYPNKKVFYLTSERFGSECLNALQLGKANEFKEKYRKYDVLIMDDIQFFSSKEKFQEELFHLFNTFHNTNRQLVFTSDRHPNTIPGLEDRLRSRFAAGMIIDIPNPDLESRIAIIETKAKSQNIEFEKDLLLLLAQELEGSIREIEGSINNIICQINLKQRPLSLTEIKNIIKNTAKPKKNVSVREVVKKVSEFYNLSEEIIYDKTRKKEVVKPRQVIMYILREDFNISYPSIGDKLGGRDHTTVIHSCDKVKNSIKNDPVFAEEIEQVRSLL